MNFEIILLVLFTTIIPVALAFISRKNFNDLKKREAAFEKLRQENDKKFNAKKDTLKFR